MTSGAPRVMVLVVILRGTRGDHLVAATDEVMHEFSSGDVLLQMSRAASNVMIAVVSLSLSFSLVDRFPYPGTSCYLIFSGLFFSLLSAQARRHFVLVNSFDSG